MGVKESREFSRRVIHRELFDDSGERYRDPTIWERVIFCLRRPHAGHSDFHEHWMAFFVTPDWVHYLRAEYLDGWLYYPVKERHMSPAVIGKKVGEWFGKSAKVFETMAADPSFAGEIVSAGLEPLEYGDDISECIAPLISSESKIIWKKRALVVGRCARLASLAVTSEAAAYFTGFATGYKNGLAIVNQRETDISFERHFVASMLVDRWETIIQMSSRSELRDFIAERLPARMRGSFQSEDGRQAFHGRILALCKEAGINLASRGKPKGNGKTPE